MLKARNIEDIARVQRELDYYKARDATVQTKLSIGAQHFLDCIAFVEKDRKDQESKILSGLDAEITKHMDDTNKAKLSREKNDRTRLRSSSRTAC